MYKVSKKWHSDLTTKEDVAEMKALVIEASRVLERLEAIVSSKQDASVTDMRGISNYGDASWAHKMADHIGYQRALDEVKTLIKIKHQEQ